MRGGKPNKEAIFQTAFKTFLGADYGTVSIQDIEDSGDFTRGALFYYAKTKPAIFSLAMEIGLFGRMRKNEELDVFVNQPKTLSDFLYFYSEWMEQPVKIIMEAKACDRNEAVRLYLRLLTSADDVMPDFTERFKASDDKIREAFLFIIARAKKQGELLPTTDVEQLTNEFMLTAWGCYVSASLKKDCMTAPISHLLNIYSKYKKA